MYAYAGIVNVIPHEFITHFLYFEGEEFNLKHALSLAYHFLPDCFSEKFLSDKVDLLFQHYNWMK